MINDFCIPRIVSASMSNPFCVVPNQCVSGGMLQERFEVDPGPYRHLYKCRSDIGEREKQQNDDETGDGQAAGAGKRRSTSRMRESWPVVPTGCSITGERNRTHIVSSRPNAWDRVRPSPRPKRKPAMSTRTATNMPDGGRFAFIHRSSESTPLNHSPILCQLKIFSTKIDPMKIRGGFIGEERPHGYQGLSAARGVSAPSDRLSPLAWRSADEIASQGIQRHGIALIAAIKRESPAG